jgi:hypothetical protein
MEVGNKMYLDAVSKYILSDVHTPYFLFISDRQYASVLDELSVLGFICLKTSDYCGEDDKIPDIDELFESIGTADINVKNRKLAVLGLGEYLALRGSVEAANTLLRLKTRNFGGAKVVLVLRGLATQIAGLQADQRFDKRCFSVVDKADCGLSFTLAAPSAGLAALTGFKSMLSALENGRCGNIVVNTTVNIDNPLITVHKISSAYEGIKFAAPGFGVPHSCGTEDQWAELLSELNQNNGFLNEVIEKHGFTGDLEADFYSHVAADIFKNWLYFIVLKQRSAILKNSYLQFVINITSRFDDFKANVLNAIIDIPHTDKRFDRFYLERKALVEKFPESDIADFVVNNRKDPAESIYKLTDRTKTEREEIIAWISQNGLIPQIAAIYPALTAYMNTYHFNCGELSSLLTDYFDAYKRQKVLNKLEDEFLVHVNELAVTRKYNRLPARSDIIEKIDKDDTFLFWLDALSVEYLAYISEKVRSRGLSISINIARAELPTITSINRGFFDNWTGPKNGNNGDKELDEIKHKEAGRYNFTKNKFPIHLAKELDIIDAVVDRAATELSLRHYKRFLIASDHGASRLVVLRCKEEQYQTDTQGEHSGRCCKKFEPYSLPFAAEENGYLVLADYGRFKGSRAANVEVHGGASLEEVVVPIIELTLKNSNVTVKLVEDSVMVDSRAGTAVTLFANVPLENVSLVLNGKRYSASPSGENHYTVVLPDTRRAGDYPADVYAGDDLIGKIQIKAQGKSGKVDDAFDDLF